MPRVIIRRPNGLVRSASFFFFNDTPTTEIYTLSLHDALPILGPRGSASAKALGLKADLIFALGTRLGFTTTLFNNSYIRKGATIIQSDIEPSEIGRIFPIALGIVGDASAVAAGCVSESRKREGLKQLKDW